MYGFKKTIDWCILTVIWLQDVAMCAGAVFR